MALPDPNDRVYNTKTLSKWFAISSIILLLTIVWIVLQDYDREWKTYSRQHMRIETAIGKKRLLEAEKNLNASKMSGLKKQLADARGDLTQLNKEINAKIEKLKGVHYEVNLKYQGLKSELEGLQFFMNSALHKNDKKKYEKLKAQFVKDSAVVEVLRNKEMRAAKAMDDAMALKTDMNSNYKKISGKITKLTSQIAAQEKIIQLNEESLFNLVRNAPLADALVPSIKIKQIILPKLKEDYHFNLVERVDRCINCHALIDKPGFEKMPQPFTSHPNLKQYLSSNSPHPLNKIGCTSCHAGSPRSLDFSNAGHTPKDHNQKHEWKEKYGFYVNHHLETPMLPTKMTEGSCVQCHAKQNELANAPVFNRGMRLIERSGCYECHKFKGYFAELSDKVEHAPSLKAVASKLTKEWVAKWIWDPKSFSPTTRMPAFYKLHNNSDEASLKRSAVELDGMVEYLFAKTKKYEPLEYPVKLASDVNIGKELVGSLGCLGCHAVKDFPRSNPEVDPEDGYPAAMAQVDSEIYNFGPELNQMGSKVTKEWLYSWLKNPKHYWKKTNMPSLRLNDQEAVNIAAYLMEMKNDSFEALTVPSPEDAVRDDIIISNFNKQLPVEEAKVKLASMSLHDKQIWVGEKMIGHYGCAMCHAIEGFETQAKIGAELSYEGSKSLSKFTFDNVKTPHTRHDWIKTKIRTPRIFDVGVERGFDAKTKMPQFGFNHDQAEAIAAIVNGYKKSVIDEDAKFAVDERWHNIIEGQKLVRRKNCVGCHVIEDKGGDILGHFEDDFSEGPPNLNKQGQKTRPEWLFGFLKQPYPIRPWLSVRMPTYGLSDDESTALTKYFAALDNEPYPFYTNDYSILSQKDKVSAEKLFAEHACLSCHAVLKPGEDASGSGPNLANVKVRLKGNYVYEWLKDPLSIMPGTRMPQLWPKEDEEDPKSAHIAVPDLFGDDAEKQMKAMRDYLFQYGGEPAIPKNVPVPRTPTYTR